MIYLTAPTKTVIAIERKEQIVKNRYIESIKDGKAFYTGVMTYECAYITKESYDSCFPEYTHEVKYVKDNEEQ